MANKQENDGCAMVLVAGWLLLLTVAVSSLNKRLEKLEGNEKPAVGTPATSPAQ